MPLIRLARDSTFDNIVLLSQLPGSKSRGRGVENSRSVKCTYPMILVMVSLNLSVFPLLPP